MDSFHRDEKFYTDAMRLIFNKYPDIIRFQCRIPYADCDVKYLVYAEQAHELFKTTGISIYNGVSKCVLIGEGSNYVCKFPRNAMNDCQREVEIYNQSIAEGVDKYFAPCAEIESCHNMPLYLMERMETPNAEEVYSHSDSYYNSYYSSDECDEGSAWKYLCEVWGSDCLDLRVFMIKYGINDIHDENIGFDNKGILKIIDYSGFHGFGYTLHAPSMKSLIQF